MDETLNDNIGKVLKRLARGIVLSRIETEALGEAIVSVGVVPLEAIVAARQNAIDRYSELLNTIGASTDRDFLQVLERTFPSR